MKKALGLPLFLLSIFGIGCSEIHKADKLEVSGGTTTITYFKNDSVWMASDSRLSTYSNEVNTTVFDTVCKLRKAGNIFYLVSGSLVRYGVNGVKTFDASQLFFDMATKDNNVSSLLPAYDIYITDTLLKIANHIKAEDKSLYARLFEDDHLLQVTAVTFAGNAAQLSSYKYYIPDSKADTLQLLRNTLNQSQLRKLPTLLIAGSQDSIRGFLATHPKFYASGLRPDKKLDSMIKMEAVAKPQNVALPVDMVLVYKDGFKWIHQQTKCK